MPGRYAPGPGYMDWANQPDPFRRFSGARLFKLPLVPDDRTPPYDSVLDSKEIPPRPLTVESLGLFLELSLGITAWKQLQDTRWALRSKANRLSPDRVDWPEITAVEAATVKPSTASLPFADSGATSARALGPRCETVRAAVIIRQRRSAVQLDGKTGLSLDAFFRMLARTLPDRSHPPWRAINFSARVHLCLFVHRIDKLSPGLYVLVRDGARLDAFRDACHPRFAWEHVESSDIPLYALALGDCRAAATHASCFQEIAGDSAFSLGMVADFARTLDEEGAWAYRRLFWESGLIGQVLYLEAEAAGVRSTGMGCYFDDFVHQLFDIDLSDDAWQSLYHFTVGGAVDDVCLTTLPAYGHLPLERTSSGRSGI